VLLLRKINGTCNERKLVLLLLFERVAPSLTNPNLEALDFVIFRSSKNVKVALTQILDRQQISGNEHIAN
jgi:hypothetical protein